MLSLFGTDQIHGWATRLHRLQQNPLIVFGAAVGAILLASLIRWALGGLVHDRIPFTTYYPAIVVATVLGGFWLGLLASMLSAVLAWGLFMHPVFDGAQITSLIAFILVCILLVGAVAALNAAVELLLVEIHTRRKAHIGLAQLASVQTDPMRNPRFLNGSGRGNASNIMKLCGFARTASSSIFP